MEYMPTVPYFARNAKETAELQREAGDLRATVESKTAPWVERTRAEGRLQTVERELQMARTAERQAGHAAQHLEPASAAANAGRQEFMPCVPYFAEPGRAAQVVDNAAPVEWPASFYDRWKLLEAAIAEVRRLKLA